MADPGADRWGGMYLVDHTVGSRSWHVDPGTVLHDVTSDLTPLA
ncbi:hypothetical protein [Phycicoccus sp. HDW14]|nr:hypothetical protein [Phycicoccus sp. HDW14]